MCPINEAGRDIVARENMRLSNRKHLCGYVCCSSGLNYYLMIITSLFGSEIYTPRIALFLLFASLPALIVGGIVGVLIAMITNRTFNRLPGMRYVVLATCMNALVAILLGMAGTEYIDFDLNVTIAISLLAITQLLTWVIIPMLLPAPPSHLCEYCGYDLRFITSTQCPECGRSNQ